MEIHVGFISLLFKDNENIFAPPKPLIKQSCTKWGESTFWISCYWASLKCFCTKALRNYVNHRQACTAGHWKAPGWCNLALWLRKYLEEHVLLILPTGPRGWRQFWLLPFVPVVTISYLSANWPINSILFLMDQDGNIPRLLRSTFSSWLSDASCLTSLITVPRW